MTPWTARFLCPCDSPGEDPGVGCHSLVQGIFPTQGLNGDLLHCRQILYCLRHQASIRYTSLHVRQGHLLRRAADPVCKGQTVGAALLTPPQVEVRGRASTTEGLPTRTPGQAPRTAQACIFYARSAPGKSWNFLTRYPRSVVLGSSLLRS